VCFCLFVLHFAAGLNPRAVFPFAHPNEDQDLGEFCIYVILCFDILLNCLIAEAVYNACELNHERESVEQYGALLTLDRPEMAMDLSS